MGQSGEIAIDCHGAGRPVCKSLDLPALRLVLSVVLPTPRFSSRVRAPAFLFRAALWQSHYAIPLPNASAPFVRAVRPLFRRVIAVVSPLFGPSSPRSARSARTWLLICPDSNRNRRDKMSAVLPRSSHQRLRAERLWQWRG